MGNRKRSWSVLALVGLSSTATATWQPQLASQVRKGDANSLTIRLGDVKAALVEVEVDGVLVATRHLAGRAPMLALTLHSAGLAPGKHQALVKVYDAQGRLLSQHPTLIELLPDASSPLVIVAPRNGMQVAGTVPIEARLSSTNSVYVSFFVDGHIRGLRNYPPYVYYWDTTRESNGWHTIEVWSYDGNQTLRTPPTRVFVNNPDGRTARESTPNSKEGAPAVQVALSEATDAANTPRLAAAPKTYLNEEVRLSAPESSAKPSLAPETAEPPLRAIRNESTPAQSSPNRLSTSVQEPSLVVARITPTQAKRTLNTVPAVPQMRGQKLYVPRVDLAPSMPSAKRDAPRTENPLIRLEYGVRLPARTTLSGSAVNSVPLTLDITPIVENGAVLVPIRSVLEPLGARLRWDNRCKVAILELGGHTAVLRVRENEVRVDDVPVLLEARLRIHHGRVLIPISALPKAFGIEILYDSTTGQLLIHSTNTKRI